MGKPFKDFGRGFYLSQNYGHAVNMALRNQTIEIRRLARRGIMHEVIPWVYAFEIDTGKLDNLSVKNFSNASKEWVLFVTENRTTDPHRHTYDIVIGPTANDQTNPTIQTYLNEGYGNVGSDRAIEILIELLLPYNLPYQYFFGTNHAAEFLLPIGRSAIE
jgi:hypothetical protein